MEKQRGNPRRKGHNFERIIVKSLKEKLGHHAGTTRDNSKKLDDCGIDIIGTDVLIQCKAGYATKRPKYEDIYDYIHSQLANRFGADHAIHQYPILLVHNLDVGSGKKRLSQHTHVTMTWDDYINFRSGNIKPILQIL